MSQSHRIFRGIGASPGVAIGHVLLLNRNQVNVPRYHIKPSQVAEQVQRLHDAVAKSVEQLQSIRQHFSGSSAQHLFILEAHEMMLGDKALVAEANQLIGDEYLNAEWALHRVISRIGNLFESFPDAYLRERRGDIDFVGERIIRNLVGQQADIPELQATSQDMVVVARDLSPVDTALLTRYKVVAFVTEAGGKTSHTSIVARSLEVPAVVGVQGILHAAGSGDAIVVDGLDGTVMLRPSRSQLSKGRLRAAHFQRMLLDLLEAKALPACTLDGRDISIAGNIELPQEIASVLDRGGESIGLYRTEFMFMHADTLPSEQDHYQAYCQMLKELGQRPVTVRTLDLGGDKIMGPLSYHHEANPALGLRAMRFCLQNRGLFEAQIAGLLRAAAQGELQIMLPMISNLDELRQAKEIIAQVGEQLEREGKPYRRDVPIGVMIEVPSAALCVDILSRECDFLAIGTNDLLQYLLATDRTNERVAYLYRPLQPAVLRLLQQIIQASIVAEIPICVCGELAGDIEFVPILIGMGFNQLSMNPGAIPKIKRLIRELAFHDCVSLIDQAFECTTTEEIEQLVKDFLAAKISLDNKFLQPIIA